LIRKHATPRRRTGGFMKRERSGNLMVSVGLAILLTGMSWGSALAQTKLMKPAKGFPIVISKPGSYFLGGNLLSTQTNFAVISVNVNNVTINLNGFTIAGPGGAGTAKGINAAGDSGVTIINGTITKIAGTAIVLGSNSTVGGVQIVGNSGDGLDCTSTCLVTNNIVSGNGAIGLNFSDAASGYQNNIISGNVTTVTGGVDMGNNVCNGSKLCP
jgi:hypothetical protein